MSGLQEQLLQLWLTHANSYRASSNGVASHSVFIAQAGVCCIECAALNVLQCIHRQQTQYLYC